MWQTEEVRGVAGGGSEVGPKGQDYGSGEGPQTLAQLQGTGAEVVGSDGENIGDLKTVGAADFVVGRTLRGTCTCRSGTSAR